MGQPCVKGLVKRDKYYHIDTQLKGYGRIRGSTGESSLEEAAKIFNKKLADIKNALKYGERPTRTFEEAATKFLEERLNTVKSVARDAQDLKLVMPYIGELDITLVHDDNLEEFKKDRLAQGRRPGTINRTLRIVQLVLNHCVKWRDKKFGLTWLLIAPKITELDNSGARKGHQMTWDEQDFLFEHMAEHLQTMTLWGLNVGGREQEIVGLRWEWEFRVNLLDVSVFVIPGEFTKNGKDKLVVLNSVARTILEAQRSKHPVFVFTRAQFVHEDPNDRHSAKVGVEYLPVTKIYNSGWKAARKSAAAGYSKKFKGAKAPESFAKLRVHDLRHTFATRLRNVGVSVEDRQDLLGHEAGRVTTHYSAAEIGNLLAAVEKIAVRSVHNSPTLTAVHREIHQQKSACFQNENKRL